MTISKILWYMLYAPIFLCIELPTLIMVALISCGEKNPFEGFLDKESQEVE